MTAPPVGYEQLHRTWSDRVTALQQDVWRLSMNRQIWTDMKDALGKFDDSTFLGHYTYLYTTGQAASVRRLADAKATGSTVSIARLLTDVKKNPAVLSRGRYVDCWLKREPTEDLDMRSIAEETYDAHFGDDGNISTMKIDSQIERLRKSSVRVKDFVDRTIAHLDERGVLQLPTFDDLNASIDATGEALQFSALLISCCTPVLDIAIHGDWKQPFRGPFGPS